MILIADSGSTKTDWCYGTETANCKIVQTEGINPFHQSEERYGLSSMMNFFHNWTLHSSVARLFTSMAPDACHPKQPPSLRCYKNIFRALTFLWRQICWELHVPYVKTKQE